VQVGPLVGNDYVVLGGVKAGDKVIVAGIQKIGDGAPVMELPTGRGPAEPPKSGEAASPKPTPQAGRRRTSVISGTFIKRPILATVSSAMVILAGAIAIPTLPLARYRI
jgi:hypothetical protein